MAEEQITKSFVCNDVRRLTVKTGRIRGTLFLPPKPGPGIITLYGGVNKGKAPEDRLVHEHVNGIYMGLALI